MIISKEKYQKRTSEAFNEGLRQRNYTYVHKDIYNRLVIDYNDLEKKTNRLLKENDEYNDEVFELKKEMNTWKAKYKEIVKLMEDDINEGMNSGYTLKSFNNSHASVFEEIENEVRKVRMATNQSPKRITMSKEKYEALEKEAMGVFHVGSFATAEEIMTGKKEEYVMGMKIFIKG